MNEQELRAEVEKRRRLPENTWRLLVDLGFVEAAVYEEGVAFGRAVEYLLDAYDQLADGAPARTSHKKPSGRAPKGGVIPTQPAQLTSYEVGRSEVYSEFLAELASNTTTVRRLRSRLMDNALLTPEQARDLLRSPFAANHDLLWFRTYKIPMVGHSHRVKEEGEDDKGPYSLVETFGQSHSRRSLKDRRPIKTGPRVVADHKHRAREFDEAAQQVGRYDVLPFPAEDGEPHRALVWPNSVLGYLRRQAQRLLRDYPWFEGDAVWFLLTGETPYVAPMTMRAKFREHTTLGPHPSTKFGYGLVTLTIEPWVSADTVQHVYRDIQRQVLRGDNRPIGPKRRRLLSFVTHRAGSTEVEPAEKRSLGKQLVAEWNQLHPEWGYGGDTRAFWRDYNLARRLITSPDYHPINGEQD